MKRFDLFFIRHGHSCANLSRELDFLGFLHDIAPNAPLDLLGMKQASHLHDRLQHPPPPEAGYYPLYDLNQVDLVVSSELLRAVETAMLIFQGRTDPIEVVPYLSECRFFLAKQLNLDPENQPDSPRVTLEKIEMLKKAFPTWFSQTPEVSYDIRGKGDPTSSNHENFLTFLPHLFRHVIRKHPEKRHYRIALVTHGLFMEKLLFGYPLPRKEDIASEPPHDEYRMPNTAVWLQVVSWSEKEGIMVYHQSSLYPQHRDPMTMKIHTLLFPVTNADHPKYVPEMRKAFCRGSPEKMLAPCALFYDMKPLIQLCSTKRSREEEEWHLDKKSEGGSRHTK